MIEESSRARAIAEIREALTDNRGGIFVGAGASQGSGLPGWKGLLTELIDILKGQPGIDPQTISDCKELLEDWRFSRSKE